MSARERYPDERPYDRKGRTERDEQAAIASNAVTKGAAYALENERLRAERDQLSEIIDTWGFCWMEEREAWQREREQEAVQLTVGGGLTVRGTMEAISRAQSLLLLNSAHPQEREDVRRSLARALASAEKERDALRAEVLQLRKNLLRTWAAAEVREYDLRKLVAQQREALVAIVNECTKGVGEITWPPGVALIAKARAALAQEVPRE